MLLGCRFICIAFSTSWSMWPDSSARTSVFWNFIRFPDSVPCSATGDLPGRYKYSYRCRKCSLRLVSNDVCPTYISPHSHGILLTPGAFSPTSPFTGLQMFEFLFVRMWTIFILNFPTNLLVLYDFICRNDELAMQISIFFCVLLLHFLYTAP
jgi:hypothetical protein